MNQDFLNQNQIQNEILNENQISESQIFEHHQVMENTINGKEIKIEEDDQYSLSSESSIMSISSNSIQLTSKTGYFYIQISGNGKTTKRLIKVELSSTDMTKEQTVKFSEAGVTGYSDNHNFQISTTTSKTKQTGDYYTILTMNFTYTKPAHYMSSGEYSNKVDGYRFNFKKYTLENEGSSTVNNTGHNISDTTETISLQINVANCGINQSSNQYVATNATGIINLSKKYYSLLQINPDGGTHNGKTSTYNYGTKLCATTVSIPNPTKKGYQFTGWTLLKGSYCTGASFNSSTNKFIYCGKSTTTANVDSNNTCVLKANWKIVYGTITVKILDEKNNGLKNGKYSLYDSNNKLVQTLDSGINNEVKFEKLPVGVYRICEEKIQNGYELIKTNAIKVEITETNIDIVLKINHEEKMILPEAGGISKDLGFLFIGIILIIILKKKRRN